MLTDAAVAAEATHRRSAVDIAFSLTMGFESGFDKPQFLLHETQYVCHAGVLRTDPKNNHYPPATTSSATLAGPSLNRPHCRCLLAIAPGPQQKTRTHKVLMPYYTSSRHGHPASNRPTVPMPNTSMPANNRAGPQQWHPL